MSDNGPGTVPGRFTIPRFTVPRFTVPRFTVPRFTVPRFAAPRPNRIARVFSAAAATTTLLVVGAADLSVASVPANASRGEPAFERTATYPVTDNRPAGADAAAATAAEISSVSKDGKTLVYTDAYGQRLGFLDISDPGSPRGLGTLSLLEPGDAHAEPTSVTVVGGYALVAVNTSANCATPSGRLDVIKISTRERVRSLDMGGQPDSIAVSRDQRYAAVAIENERDETVIPPNGTAAGDLPQQPGGFLQIVDLPTGDPNRWAARKVAFTGTGGEALTAFVAAGIVDPIDPEPEYVSISANNQIAVTLQENNGVVVVDARTGAIVTVFSAGTTSVGGIDTVNDAAIVQTGSITDRRREPDAVGWVDNRYLATADEGDWRGGVRGWSIFDSRTGAVVWTAGNSIERLTVRYGVHNEARAGSKGAEPEGLTIAEYDGVRYAFVALERSNVVVVYDLSRPTSPALRQVLPTGAGPEGLLAIPRRGLLAVSSETDNAAVGLRANVSLYRLGSSRPAFPSLVSSDDAAGVPLGWGALGALSAVPGQPGKLYTVADARYRPTRILTIDARRTPATITAELPVTDASGNPVGYDAEGLYARPQGGFWLVSEGATGPQNALIRLAGNGVVQQVVQVPPEVASGLADQGLHGVTAITDRGGREQVWVVLRGRVASDPTGVARLGRFDVASNTWAWFGYRLEPADATSGGTPTGLSEITAVGPGTLAVVERDAVSGPAARIKRIYTVEVPRTDPAAGTLPVLAKSLAYDALPSLRATRGWLQEKIEGLAVGCDGHVYAVTDNDGMLNATGETVFLRIGTADTVFGKRR